MHIDKDVKHERSKLKEKYVLLVGWSDRTQTKSICKHCKIALFRL